MYLSVSGRMRSHLLAGRAATNADFQVQACDFQAALYFTALESFVQVKGAERL